mgnify:CR=1 FL=1
MATVFDYQQAKDEDGDSILGVRLIDEEDLDLLLTRSECLEKILLSWRNLKAFDTHRDAVIDEICRTVRRLESPTPTGKGE